MRYLLFPSALPPHHFTRQVNTTSAHKVGQHGLQMCNKSSIVQQHSSSCKRVRIVLTEWAELFKHCLLRLGVQYVHTSISFSQLLVHKHDFKKSYVVQMVMYTIDLFVFSTRCFDVLQLCWWSVSVAAENTHPGSSLAAMPDSVYKNVHFNKIECLPKKSKLCCQLTLVTTEPGMYDEKLEKNYSHASNLIWSRVPK